MALSHQPAFFPADVSSRLSSSVSSLSLEKPSLRLSVIILGRPPSPEKAPLGERVLVGLDERPQLELVPGVYLPMHGNRLARRDGFDCILAGKASRVGVGLEAKGHGHLRLGCMASAVVRYRGSHAHLDHVTSRRPPWLCPYVAEQEVRPSASVRRGVPHVPEGPHHKATLDFRQAQAARGPGVLHQGVVVQLRLLVTYRR